jgi:hypothetical protein
MIVTENRWAHPCRVVDVFVAVDVSDHRAVCTSKGEWHGSTHESHVRIHTTRNDTRAPFMCGDALGVAL